MGFLDKLLGRKKKSTHDHDHHAHDGHDHHDHKH